MRAIDADELLAEYDRHHKGPAGGARKMIEDAPTIRTIQPEPHWIPVEQDLPPKNGAYLVTAEGFPVSIKFYSADSYGWGEEWRRVITAWMPLPEPYKGVTT